MVLPASASLQRPVSFRGHLQSPNPPPCSCSFSAVWWPWVSTTADSTGSHQQSALSDPRPSRKSEATPRVLRWPPGRCAGRCQLGFMPRCIACIVCSRRRTRRDRIVRTRLTRSGASSSSRQKCERSTMSSRRSVVATIVADRGSPSSRLISPKKSPGCSCISAPAGVRTVTAPSMMMKNESPGSPVCVTTVPAGTSAILESSATRPSSSSLSPLKSGTRCKCKARASREGAVAPSSGSSKSKGSVRGSKSTSAS